MCPAAVVDRSCQANATSYRDGMVAVSWTVSVSETARSVEVEQPTNSARESESAKLLKDFMFETGSGLRKKTGPASQSHDAGVDLELSGYFFQNLMLVHVAVTGPLPLEVR